MPNTALDAHHIAVSTAKSALQVSLKTAATEADRTTAHITYHKAVIASARAQGIKTNSIAQLARLGIDPADWRAGDA
jgi:hypothetical protein